MVPAVILAGGKGTRLGALSQSLPKPLMPLAGTPLIEHQLRLLAEQGVNDVWILLGHLGDQIQQSLGDGSRWGLTLHYLQESMPLGTAGALLNLKPFVHEDFILFSGDILLNIDLARLVDWHQQKTDAIMTLIVHPSDHPLDSDLVEVNSQDQIQRLLIRPHPRDLRFRNLGIASAYIASPQLLDYIPVASKTDLEKDILPLILQAGQALYAYNTPEYLKDMGTPERLLKGEKDWQSGKVQRRSLKVPQKAVFLDRDGVLNHEVDQLHRLVDFKLYPEAIEALQRLNQSDYLAVVITNQPMVAKGLLTEADLAEIHKQMETELGHGGARLDAIYYCPHHPESGFPGEIPALKFPCLCRKPNIGMIQQAQQAFNLDLAQCFLIGDSTVDAETARLAGIAFKGVQTGYALQDGHYPVGQVTLFPHVLAAVREIVG